MEKEIEIRDLNLWYGKNQALKNVNFDIFKNNVTALIGPSGCGKSTLLRCINRLNDIVHGCKVKGSVQLGGRDIYGKGTDIIELRRKVGMVFQKPNPFPFSIWENVAYGPKMAGINDDGTLENIVERSLKRAAIWNEVSDRLYSSAGNLSGGQQQRLCIARALAMNPEIILMDEPCSALDPIATKKIEDLIFELKKDYTVVIVTHNMMQARRASDHTAFMLMGELVEIGETVDMFQRPAEQKTADYVAGKFG